MKTITAMVAALGLAFSAVVLAEPPQLNPTAVPDFSSRTLNISPTKDSVNSPYDLVIPVNPHSENGFTPVVDMPVIINETSRADVDQIIAMLKGYERDARVEFGKEAKYVKVKLEVAGWGGDSYQMAHLIDAIRYNELDITIHIVGDTYSAHSLIAIAGDHMITEEGKRMMFHHGWMKFFLTFDGYLIDNVGNVISKEGKSIGQVTPVGDGTYRGPNGQIIPGQDRMFRPCSKYQDFYGHYWIKKLSMPLCERLEVTIHDRERLVLSPEQYDKRERGADVYVNSRQVVDYFTGRVDKVTYS